MGFSSIDNFIQSITTNGQLWRQDWNKQALPTTAQAAGLWYDLYQGTGNPGAGVMGVTTTVASIAWTQSGATVTATANNHGLATGCQIAVTATSDATHVANGTYTLTGASTNTFTFTGVTGGTSGTFTYGLVNLNFYPMMDSNIQAPNAASGIPHGGNVSSATKHIINVSAFTAASTVAPCVLQLVDIVGFIPITTTTATGAQSIVNQATMAASLPRYTDGKGLQAYLVPSTVMGTPNTATCQLSYTNTVSASGRLTPAALPLMTASAPVGSIAYSGSATAQKYGPFLPRAAGDLGITSIQSINFSATQTSGVLNLVLCRPLLTVPITTLGVATERDLINQIPSLPRVYDGAVLNWLMYAGANTPVSSNLYGHIEFGWN